MTPDDGPVDFIMEVFKQECLYALNEGDKRMTLDDAASQRQHASDLADALSQTVLYAPPRFVSLDDVLRITRAWFAAARQLNLDDLVHDLKELADARPTEQEPDRDREAPPRPEPQK
jgi:hypothetical protein